MAFEHLKLSVKQPLFSYNYDIVLPSDLDPSGNVAERIQSVNLPGLSLQSDSGFPWLPNRNINLPTGLEMTSGITLTFAEFEDSVVTKFLEKWFNLIINEDGTMNPPKTYWRNVKIYMNKSINTLFGMAQKINVIDCYPTNVYKRDLSYDQNSIVMVEVPLMYQYIEREPGSGGLVGDVKDKVLGAL